MVIVASALSGVAATAATIRKSEGREPCVRDREGGQALEEEVQQTGLLHRPLRGLITGSRVGAGAIGKEVDAEGRDGDDEKNLFTLPPIMHHQPGDSLWT
ncbi:MAG: hypothetical protein FE78DRAFT_36162 [Acidomyces sp. 'richmondensis']|nr:MAG: hypothetical protein FE78DRAFT_36162 [Acidomyces sp. 'richmondensis']